MIIVDTLPSSVELGGKEYKINTDFRYWVLFEMLMQDNDVEELEKLEKMLELFFDEDIDINTDFKEIFEAIMWFYSCGNHEKRGPNKNGRNKRVNIYDFEVDSDYIYSAFLTQYGIDLSVDNLHWWKFKALFKSLKSDNEIVKIMGYRSIEVTSDMTKEEQKFYREMKEIYSLKDNRTDDEKEEDFYTGFSAMF